MEILPAYDAEKRGARPSERYAPTESQYHGEKILAHAITIEMTR